MDIVSKINGNTLSATEFNQIPTELEALQTSSGQTSSDAILNQASIATSRYAANNFYIDSGAANAYILRLAASMTNPVSATVGYFIGMTIRFRAGNANTGASTVNVNSAGVKNLKKEDGTDLSANSILTTRDVVFRYDGTDFIKEEHVSLASTSEPGIVQLATAAEIIAGTNNSKAITPAALAGSVSFVKNTIGYEQNAQGFIRNFGVVSLTAGAAVTITLPKAFPTIFTGAFAQGESNGVDEQPAGAVRTSLSQIRVSNGFGFTANIMWEAFGY